MLVVILSIFIFFLDQLSKYLIRNQLSPGESIPIIKNYFQLTYVQNRGAAFGIFPGKRIFLVVAAIFLTFVLIYIYHSLIGKTLIHKIAFALIFGGNFGNLYDRISVGFVTDFLDFKFWPVFNLADTALVIGLFTLLGLVWRSDIN